MNKSKVRAIFKEHDLNGYLFVSNGNTIRGEELLSLLLKVSEKEIYRMLVKSQNDKEQVIYVLQDIWGKLNSQMKNDGLEFKQNMF